MSPFIIPIKLAVHQFIAFLKNCFRNLIIFIESAHTVWPAVCVCTDYLVMGIKDLFINILKSLHLKVTNHNLISLRKVLLDFSKFTNQFAHFDTVGGRLLRPRYQGHISPDRTELRSKCELICIHSTPTCTYSNQTSL